MAVIATVGGRHQLILYRYGGDGSRVTTVAGMLPDGDVRAASLSGDALWFAVRYGLNRVEVYRINGDALVADATLSFPTGANTDLADGALTFSENGSVLVVGNAGFGSDNRIGIYTRSAAAWGAPEFLNNTARSLSLDATGATLVLSAMPWTTNPNRDSLVSYANVGGAWQRRSTLPRPNDIESFNDVVGSANGTLCVAQGVIASSQSRLLTYGSINGTWSAPSTLEPPSGTNIVDNLSISSDGTTLVGRAYFYAPGPTTPQSTAIYTNVASNWTYSLIPRASCRISRSGRRLVCFDGGFEVYAR